MFVGSVSSLEAFKQNKRFAIVHKKYKVIHIYKYMLKLNLKINKTHTFSSFHFQNGEVAVEDHQSPISAQNFFTSREVLPHHELHKGILESSASGK